MSDAFSSSELLKNRTRSFGRADELPARAYILALTLFITGGLLAATYIASLTYTMKTNGWWILGYFALAIPGIIISTKSDNWIISLLGYAMVVVPTGAILGPYVHLFTIASVLNIALVTIGVSAAIGLAGAVYPKSVEHWGGFLLTALLVLIVGNFASIFIPALNGGLHLWDWLGVFIFSGFIFYDMNRAMRMDYTLDNAVDNAVAFYLDIINLFIRLLSIFGDKSSSD